MKRILMITVATIILLWSTTPITARASSILQTRTYRTNLVKGEYVETEVVDEEAGELEEPTPSEEPDKTIEEYIGETEEEHETEVQGPE